MKATIKFDNNEVSYILRQHVAKWNDIDKIREIRILNNGTAEIDVELTTPPEKEQHEKNYPSLD